MQRLFTRAVFATVISVAAAEANAFVVIGNSDCGDWVSRRTTATETWVLGYLSGMYAVVDSRTSDPLRSISSANQIYVWMDNYCRNNPLESVSSGARQLFLELQKRAGTNK
jgi:hypothetical protein